MMMIMIMIMIMKNNNMYVYTTCTSIILAVHCQYTLMHNIRSFTFYVKVRHKIQQTNSQLSALPNACKEAKYISTFKRMVVDFI